MWDYKTIRSNAWKTTFRRGFNAWVDLVSVCVLFALIGVTSTVTSHLNEIDKLMGTEIGVSQKNMDIINTYIIKNFDENKFLSSDILLSIVNLLSQKYSWFINILAANFAYFQRNSGAIVSSLIITGIVLGIFEIVFQNIFEIGLNRYAMEARFQNKTQIKRLFAPFHRKYIWNEFKVMLAYKITLFLWIFTIIGCPVKIYEYRLIPCILAENPDIKYRDAKRLSKQITKGYKWKMFLTDLSYIYIWILYVVPVVGVILSVPLLIELKAEMYFLLRKNTYDETFFIEKNFNGKPYIESGKSVESFDLKDTILSADELKGNFSNGIGRLKGEYDLLDYTAFFFIFCIIGWVWEVIFYVVCEHSLVNRGTMYGPWLPIYGIGGITIVFMLSGFKDNKIKLFFMAMLLCGVIEYSASWILDYFKNASYWDYRSYKINLNGRISLIGLIAFGLGGLAAVYIVAPRISYMVDKFGKKKSIILCSIFAFLFVADLICCTVFGFNSGELIGETF